MRRLAFSRAALAAFQEPVLAIVLVIGATAAIAWGEVSLPVLLTMLFTYYRMGGRILGVQKSLQALGESESAYWLLRDVIAGAEKEIEPDIAGEAPSLEHEIVLEGIGVTRSARQVLSGLDLTIPARRLTVLTGPSGGGKSTILDLILGILPPSRGRVRVDGADLDHLHRASWRSMIGYVPQDLWLFNETIRKNVTLGDDSFEEPQIVEALRAAGAWQFVEPLPRGIESDCGEQGARLSGGERQRIMLARSLIRNPSLLVLDEPTTALDPELERGLAETLKTLSERVTVVAVSHQPALWAVADVVWEVDGGRAVRV